MVKFSCRIWEKTLHNFGRGSSTQRSHMKVLNEVDLGEGRLFTQGRKAESLGILQEVVENHG